MSAPVSHGPFQMPMFRTFVPRSLQPWIYVLFAFSFQLTGGIYIGSLNEMIGGMSLMREDITMCMYVNLLGMAMYFPLLFRLKFRFTNKTLLMAASLTIAFCNMAAVYVHSIPLLWVLCFFAGCAKIQGTFECMSNIQLWMSPRRDFRVFFPILNTIILCSIQLSDLLTTYLCFYFNWTYMHFWIVGQMLVVALSVFLLTHHFRIIRKFPLYGIDWLGALLWSAFFFELAYIFNYGDWYSYFDSPVIQGVALVAAITLFGCIHRMFHIRHPYYEPKMWSYRYLVPVLVLITLVEVFLATEHVLEEVFYEEGMKYETIVSSQLDWFTMIGIVCGGAFALLWMKVLQFNYYRLIAIALGALSIYLIGYYLTLSTDINIEKLYAISAFRGFAYVVLSATFMQCLEELMTFQHFFQALSVFNVLHMLMGGVIGCAIYAKGLGYFMADNISRYSTYINHTTFSKSPFDLGYFMEEFIEQNLMMSCKQIYGLVAYACLALLFGVLLWDMPKVRTTLKKMPSWRSVGNQIRNTFTDLKK